MFEAEDYVKVKRKRGRYKLVRRVETPSGEVGWWTIGPEGSFHAIRETEIKKKVNMQ